MPRDLLVSRAESALARFVRVLPLALLALTDCRADGPAAPPLFSLTPPVFLPDGSEFKTWENAPLSFRRTYHVAAQNPRASDANPGTESLPFATIGQAARVLQPGERVVIHAGVYRERVTPARGGTGPAEMISYEAAPGEKAVLSGALPFRPRWEAVPAADGKAAAWRAEVPDALFPGPNPFDTQNIPPDGFKHWLEPLKGRVPLIFPRGMVFQDDRRLRQVAARDALTEEGTFWVDRPARALYVRPFGDDPGKAAFEVAARDTVFAPDQAGLGYVRVKGLTLERVAGPWPMPQLGAISTGAGHHWIVEDNTVRWDNGIGIDLGTQHGHQPPEILAAVGHHIVRRNVVTDCGVCGIAGLGPKDGTDFGLLIEDNVVLRNAYESVEETIQETGGIKTHKNKRCLIRRNLIADTYHGPAVWLDWDNGNSRLTQNVLLRNHTRHGAIFVEFSIDSNLVDRNVVWDTEGNGIYEHDTRGNVFAHNLVGKSTRAAFHLHGKMTDRQLEGREPLVAGAHQVLGNVAFQNGEQDVIQGEPGLVADNRVMGDGIVLDEAALELSWPALGRDGAHAVPYVTADFFDRPLPSGAGTPGPFQAGAAPALRLWPLVPGDPLPSF